MQDVNGDEGVNLKDRFGLSLLFPGVAIAKSDIFGPWFAIATCGWCWTVGNCMTTQRVLHLFSPRDTGDPVTFEM